MGKLAGKQFFELFPSDASLDAFDDETLHVTLGLGESN
jgi:hypothetical protein